MSRNAFGWYRGATRCVSATLLALTLNGAALPPAHAQGTAAEATPVESRPGSLFTKLYPDFIVNLRGNGSHFLMVTTQVQTRAQVDIDNALKHRPALRHHLLMLLGDVSYRDALSPEGRLKLAEDALAVVRRVLDEEAGGSEIEAVLFTSYLVE